MSLLPQRKKSAEEIAKLRETFGIPGQAPAVEEPPVAGPASAVVSHTPAESPKLQPAPAKTVPVAKAPKSPAPKPVPPVPDTPDPEPDNPSLPPVTDLESLPVLTSHGRRQVRSLRRSERIPVLPLDESEPIKITPDATAAGPHGPKVVHSLRKSELVPLTPADIHTPPADSKLPVHRHSDQELNDLRRKSAIAQHGAVVPFAAMTAHLALVIPGYLLTIAAAACFYYYELSISVTAACVAVALLIAGFIFVKKPLSRHHAAFISVIALFVIVFGALHYFPQLRHGT
ncbi:MAG: hypothetical protein ABIT37_18235 [Luteolibacter sp.]